MKKLTILLSLTTLVILFLACSQFLLPHILILLISHTPITYSGEEGERKFYNDYPELKGRVRELQARVDQERFRTTVRHYKFKIEEKALLSFINRNGYQKFDNKIQSRTKNWIVCEHAFMSLQDSSDSEMREYQYPSWWNISNVQKYTCFIEYYDRGNARERALYDRKTETLYMYSHRNG